MIKIAQVENYQKRYDTYNLGRSRGMPGFFFQELTRKQEMGFCKKGRQFRGKNTQADYVTVAGFLLLKKACQSSSLRTSVYL